MNIGKICNRKVVTADADTSVIEAAKLMRYNHVGSVVVTKSEGQGVRPVGIITDRDLTIEILAEDIDPQCVTVGDAMSRYPLAAHEDDDSYDVLDAMRKKGVRRIPVIDNEGALVGVLAVDDILRMVFYEIGSMVSLIRKEFETEERLRKAI